MAALPRKNHHIHFVKIYGINNHKSDRVPNLKVCSVTACGKLSTAFLRAGNVTGLRELISCPNCIKALYE